MVQRYAPSLALSLVTETVSEMKIPTQTLVS
jgi:hypothetical protein